MRNDDACGLQTVRQIAEDADFRISKAEAPLRGLARLERRFRETSQPTRPETDKRILAIKAIARPRAVRRSDMLIDGQSKSAETFPTAQRPVPIPLRPPQDIRA